MAMSEISYAVLWGKLRKPFNGRNLHQNDQSVYIKILTQGGCLPLPRGYICIYYITIIFKHLLQNCMASQSQIICEASMGRGNESFFRVSVSHDQDGCHAHISLKLRLHRELQSADRIFVFLSADKFHFVGRLERLH